MAAETAKKVAVKKAKRLPKKAGQTPKKAAKAALNPRVNWRKITSATKSYLAKVMGGEAPRMSVMAEAILEVLLEQPEKIQKELFGFVLNNYKLCSESGLEITHKGLTEKTWKNLAKVYNQEIEEQIVNIISPDYSSSEIVSRLWDFIMETSDQEMRIFILSCLLHDYNLVPLLTDDERQGTIIFNKDKILKDESFLKTVEEIKNKIAQISTSGLDQWWEMASALLYQVKQYESPEGRAMAMAVILLNAVEPTRKGSKDFPGIISLSDEDVAERENKLEEKIMRLVAIFKSRLFQQAPAKGSSILNLILSEADEKSQVILMTIFLREVRLAEKRSLSVIEIGGDIPLLPLLLAKLLADRSASACGQSSEKTKKPELDCERCPNTDCPFHPINGAAGHA